MTNLIEEAKKVLFGKTVSEGKQPPILDFYDVFDDDDYHWISNDSKPEVIRTGINDRSAASQLKVHRLNKHTVVVPFGEAYNSEPWVFKGDMHSLEDIKKWYLAAIKDGNA